MPLFVTKSGDYFILRCKDAGISILTTDNSGAPHQHTFDLPDHTHDIEYGIYEDTDASPPNVDVWIDGTNRTTELGGSFATGTHEVDITKFVTTTGWHTIEFKVSSELRRILASCHIQIFIQSK